MDVGIKGIAQGQRRIIYVCRVLKWLFYALFVLYLLSVGPVLFSTVLVPNGFVPVGPRDPLSVILIVVDTASDSIALFLIGYLMREVGKRGTPLQRNAANIVTVVGVMLLLGVACQMMIDPGTVFGVVCGENQMVLEYSGSEVDSVHIDVRALLESLVCFAVAAVFRYGAILQMEADDLV